jgi:outer membrane lipoprotein-sorting protein
MDELHEQETAFSKRLTLAAGEADSQNGHRVLLRARVLAEYDRALGREPSDTVSFFHRGRNLMRRPLARLLAVAACLAIFAALLLIPGQQPAAQAFHTFAAALVDAHSLTFQMEVKVEGQPPQTARSSYLAPGKMRNETKGVVSVIDIPAGKIVALLPEQKIATVMNMKNRPAAPDKPTVNDVFEQLRQLLSKSRDSKADEFQRLGEKEIDGHKAVGFRHASPLQVVTLWGDPASGLPVLVETAWSGVPRTEAKMSHFKFDPELQPSLFDTTPPAGYRVQSVDVDVSKPTEATLIDALHLAADLNDGQFMDRLDTASMQALILKQAVRLAKDNTNEDITRMMKLAMTIGRGIGFALELPESADAHYAGKGVKRGEPERPIFWYKPEGAKQYRVIYANLTARAVDKPPEVAGAGRLEKTRPSETPAK